MSGPALQPTLIGPTLELRPTVPADWDALFAVAADPAIWALHPAHDRWQEPVFRRYFDDALASGGGLTIRERALKGPTGGRVIGASRYREDAAEPGKCEIGWTFLARDHWGGAANREVKRLMIGHILQHYDAATFMIGEENIRSRRAMEKIGGRLTDRREKRVLGGVEQGHVVYQIDAPLS